MTVFSLTAEASINEEPGAVVPHAAICAGGRWVTGVPTAACIINPISAKVLAPRERLSGSVHRVTFHSEETGFCDYGSVAASSSERSLLPAGGGCSYLNAEGNARADPHETLYGELNLNLSINTMQTETARRTTPTSGPMYQNGRYCAVGVRPSLASISWRLSTTRFVPFAMEVR